VLGIKGALGEMMDKGGNSLFSGRKIEEYLANEGMINSSFFISLYAVAQNTLSN